MMQDRNDDGIWQVLARYGLAMCLAQSLEKQISILLHSADLTARGPLPTFDYEELLQEDLNKTFGAVLIALRERVECPSDVQQRLEEARQRRNWLAHDYWWERARWLHTAGGCAEMLTELEEQAAFFGELNALFQQILLTYLSLKGTEGEWIRDELIPLLQHPAPATAQARPLRERETLIGIYVHTCRVGDERVETPLFELADHTWWALSEDGLTPGPARVDRTLLRLRKDYQKGLPAEMAPRPKDAANWNYKIDLSTGYYIWVSPSTHNGMFRLRWGMRKARKQSSDQKV